jgi:hypothetical protein
MSLSCEIADTDRASDPARALIPQRVYATSNLEKAPPPKRVFCLWRTLSGAHRATRRAVPGASTSSFCVQEDLWFREE